MAEYESEPFKWSPSSEQWLHRKHMLDSHEDLIKRENVRPLDSEQFQSTISSRVDSSYQWLPRGAAAQVHVVNYRERPTEFANTALRLSRFPLPYGC